MQLHNAFVVPAPPARVWSFLLDPARVVPCMPGAELVRVVDPDTWEAAARVKVGPVSLRFKGTVAFAERDDDAHHVVLEAKGRETRGKGVFSARISSRLTPTADGTRVEVDTELNISGKMATFGRGMIADISARHTESFAAAMQAQLAAETPTATTDAPPPASGPPSGSSNAASAESSAPPVESATPTPSSPAAASTPTPASAPAAASSAASAAPSAAASAAQSSATSATGSATPSAAPSSSASAAAPSTPSSAPSAPPGPTNQPPHERPPPPQPEREINAFALLLWAVRRALVRRLKRLLTIREDEPFFAGLWRVLRTLLFGE